MGENEKGQLLHNMSPLPCGKEGRGGEAGKRGKYVEFCLVPAGGIDDRSGEGGRKIRQRDGERYAVLRC